jgi:CheY-like chemotaxis protein
MMSRRVLLVEDNPDDEELILRALKKSNIPHEVSIARDGAESLQQLFADDRADSSPPALILLDLMLPKIDGFEVLHRIRADERTRLIPVVVLTSSGQEEDILAAYLGGANAYVRKPVAFSDYAAAANALGQFWLCFSEPPPTSMPAGNKLRFAPGPKDRSSATAAPAPGTVDLRQAASLPDGTTGSAAGSMRILILEDEPADAILAQRLLAGAGLEFTAVVVDTGAAFTDQLAAFRPDVVLADFALPGFSGQDALKIAQQQCPQVPFIFLSGVIGDEEADHLVRNGATDYVLKDRPARLASVIRRALAEAEQRTQRAQLEAQLLQSRRLESIGRLAGGVAHNFNNMVGAMLNYAAFIRGLAEERAGKGIDGEAWAATRRDAEQIENVGQRVIQRVRQLLAAGGEQLVSPELVDLNQLVAGSADLLRGLLGPDVEFHLSLATQPCRVTADRGQVGQVLMELAANASDAMPDGGIFSIGTHNLTISSDEPPPHPELLPGSYVCLVIRDSGTGMEPQTLEHAFEPFFTTKPIVEGGGLGLAGVYGVVNQSGGSVGISSAPSGTTITIWLPATLPETGL